MEAADQPKLIVEADAEALAQAAAERVMARISANPGRIAICLTGGSSPKKLYQLLGSDAYRGKIPWDRVHWFIGDERFVPSSDPLNNMAVARATFLDRNAPSGHIHPIPTTAESPEAGAEAYARELQSFYGAKSLDPARPLFDMVLMGAGPDGHTASLFPGTPVLEVEDRIAAEVFVPRLDTWRVTLTKPVLRAATLRLVLATGAKKKPILEAIRDGADYPIAQVTRDVETWWLIDRDAAP